MIRNIELEKKDEKFYDIFKILSKHSSPQVNKDSEALILENHLKD